MKKNSANRSAFFNPRVLTSFAFCAIGVLLLLGVTFAAREDAVHLSPAVDARQATKTALPVSSSLLAPVSNEKHEWQRPQPVPNVVFDLLYDQNNNPGTNSTSSQNFEAANDTFDNQAADDFVVPAGQTWTVQQVVATAVYFNGTGPAVSFNVFFYSDAATLPGAVVAGGTQLNATYTNAGGVFTINLPSAVVLSPGTYWVSIQCNMDFAVGGQWGWTDRTVTSNQGAAWQNPGGGFATACNSWGRRATTCAIDPAAPDQMFQILGTGGGGGGSPTPSPSVTGTPCAGTVLNENFDGVTAPALPAGWTATNATGGAPLWVTSTTTPDTPPNAAFIDDPLVVTDKLLITPDIAVSSAAAQVSFRNSFNLEDTFDGGVLEVSSPNINAGAFTDITAPAVGGNFVTGGYTDTISTSFKSPIMGRMAWSGNGGGYINSTANLGPNVAGQTIKLRFRMASDNSVSAAGWRVDGVSVVDGACPSATPTPGTPSPTPTCVPGGGGAPGPWTTAATGPPLRYRAGGATDGNFIYVFGGGDDVGGFRNDLWRWDPATQTWAQLANMPTAKQNIQGTHWNGKIYVPGGFMTGAVHTTELAIYDIATNTWSAGAPLPAVQTGTNVAFNNKIYNFGGNPGPQAITTIYDIATNTWSTGASMPTATTYGRAVASGGFAYYVGGIAGATTAAVHRYDFAANSWTTMAPLQLARTSAELMASPDGTSIFAVMGGDATFFTGVPLAQSVEIYNIAGNSWSFGNPVVSKAAGPGGGLAGGKLMVQGGIDNTVFLNTVQVSVLGGGGGCPSATPSGTPTATATGTPASPSPTATCAPGLTEGFDDITTLTTWVQTNHSTVVGSTNWFQGNDTVFPAQSGPPTSYIGANFNNTTGTNTISNWLLTPPVTLVDGAQMSFWTRTVDTPQFPDRLQVRMSTAGASSNVGTTATDVGDFTTLLLDINPTYTLTGYPNVWTQFTVTVTGVPSPTQGRLALRYFVESGGPTGDNSDYIGIDTFVFTGPCGSPTPSSPTPTATCAAGWVAGPAFPAVGVVRAPGNYFPANGRFYSIGGRSADVAGADFTNPFEYDPVANTWATKPSTLPDGLVNNMACGVLSVGGTDQIYCVGGSQSQVVGTASRVFSYNPATDAFTTLAAADNWPGSQGGNFLPGGFAVAANKLYIIGTFNATAPAVVTAQVWQFDPNAAEGSRWLARTDYPVARAYVPAATIGGLIYTAGGSNLDPGGLLIDTADSFVYDPVSGVWTPIANIPRATGETRALVINNEMWVLGGGRVAPNPSNQVDIYNPGTNTWRTGTPFVNARRNFPADTDGTRIFLVGGYDASGTTLLNTMEIFGGGACPSPSGTPTATATATATSTGTPVPTPTVTPTASVSPTPSTTPAAQPLNLSTRMFVQTGDNVGIGGFIITGTTPKRVIVRAIGPSLPVGGALADPTLELHGPPGFTTRLNNNWRDTQEAEIIATGLPPDEDLESAIVVTLDPAAYTAIVAGNGGTTGVALVEIYDLDFTDSVLGATDSILANISTRAFVQTEANIVIAGFILGEGAGNDNLIVRGLGPSLTAGGVPNVLADPTLELRDSEGTLITGNNNWQDDAGQAALITAAGLAPGNPVESAIASTLPPGNYTALLAGAGGGTGNGIVEVYNLGTGDPIPTPTPGATATATATATGTPSGSPIATPTATATATAGGGGTCTENFDSVTAPALPPGWVATNPDPGDGVMWVTTVTGPSSPPNAAFINDQDGISDKVLDRSGVTIENANAVLSFRNNFNTEFTDGVYWDGYVLEVSTPSIGGGAFFDITSNQIGGSFVSGPYTGEISGKANNPLAGRMAWSGDSGGYIDTVINVGPNLAGLTVTLRFRMGTDEAVVGIGAWVDTLSITNASCP